MGEQIATHPCEKITESTPVPIHDKSFSTKEPLLFATENLRKSVDENENVAAASFDLSKVLNSISNKLLVQKLKEVNFDEKALTHRDGQLFPWKTSENDIKDLWSVMDLIASKCFTGYSPGPLLFNIFVNDMQQTGTLT